MKRKDIIDLLKSAGQLMDAYEKADVMNHDTGELIGTIHKGDIRGMQTALCFCVHLLDGGYRQTNPVKLINLMLDFHACATLGIDPNGCQGTEYRYAGEADVEEG